MTDTIPFLSRVEAHPHRPRVLKYREGGDDRTISVRPLPGGHVTYASLLVLGEATFDVQPSGPTRVRDVTGVRDVHAFVRGKSVIALYDEGDSKHFDETQIPEGTWVLVSYNPFRADHFYEVVPTEGGHAVGREVVAAEAVVLRGGDCIAVNPVFA